MKVLLIMLLGLLSQMASAASYYFLGVVHSSNSKNSIALLTNTETDKKFYVREHDSFDGWGVVRIQRRTVTLEREGRLYTIMKGAFMDGSNPREFKITSGIEVSDTAVRLTQALKSYIANEGLAAIVMQAAAAPYKNQYGEMIGFQVSNMDPGSIYELAGIKEWDVITAIDGVALDGYIAAIKMLRYIKEADQFTYSYLRKGKEFTKTVYIE